MSQWNNAYAYNNQYQVYNDLNAQYLNQQQHFPNRDSSNQYVSFNEFLSQMQTNPAANATSYPNVQYENYPTRDYNYQNVPPAPQNPQLDNYGYATSSGLPNGAEYQMSIQNQYNPVLPDPNSYSSEVILNSNLTPTATEFVPKSSLQPSSSSQNIPEFTSLSTENEPRSNYSAQNNTKNQYSSDTRNNFTNNSAMNEPRNYSSASSDTNWRERPHSSQQSEPNYKEPNRQRNQEPSRNRDSKYRNNDSSSRNYESNRNQESNGRQYESNYRNQESNRQYDNQDSSARQNESNSYQESNGRQYDTYNRSQESSSRYDSRSYETANKRGQGKLNYNKANKNRDADARTFYNSSINKDSQDVRNGKLESSGRGRGWAGSQRLKAMERNSTEDEQYANNYTHGRAERAEREEKREERDRGRIMKTESVGSPSRSRTKQNYTNDQVNTDLTQRERLTEQLDRGTLECLVCCERVKQIDPVWSCSNCYHVLHLRCIRKWAMSSMVEGKWRCPACQNTNEAIPTEYRCMCGAIKSPEYQRGAAGAHTCGKSCRRVRSCPHPCTLLCHPGPCPPCQATITKKCGCGAESRSVLCSSKLPQICGRQCGRTLLCGQHTCAKDCHEGPCDICEETITQVCYCPAAKSRTVSCSSESGGVSGWSCGSSCGRVLSCGAHVCRALCHAPPCAPCDRDPTTLATCPCGHTKLDPDSRKSCTDPVPLCGNICAKPLPCGPAGDKHFCKLSCHEGPCPVCPDKTVLQCRCGHSSREVPCSDLPEMYNNVFCQKKCNKKLSCGRHRCRTACCASASHRCAAPCGRSLACQAHRCDEFCHTGHCAPCPRLSFEELTCECGAEVLLPPIRCGTRPPACSAPCPRSRACGHPPHHSCHSGDCPPCVVLTTKRCHGDHEERKTIPCSQEEFSCGLPCGKPLPCGKHTCVKTCHKGPCDTGKCTQPCAEKREACAHPCGAACHSGACPSAAPCRAVVRATCRCSRRAADRYCSDNARDYAKMMSALAATKMGEGGSVDLSEVQRPGNMLKTLECDDECRVEARTRQLALALQIRNPDVSAKLAPRYSEHVRTTATKEPSFAQQIHDKLTELVQLAKKSKQKTRAHSFPSMNWQKRQFIHELCEHFGCESVAYDAEPNRNVVATADKEKSWLPAMSVLEVLAREAGKRRVPPPVLRAASAAAPAPAHHHATASSHPSVKSSGGWATLTSTNAWAARSQQNQPKPVEKPPEKIDYFDNPPDH